MSVASHDLDDPTCADELCLTDRGPVRIVTLNRPRSYNAMTVGMFHDLADVLTTAELDSEVHCLVLRAAGPAFCAGMDINNLADGSPTERRRAFTAGMEAIERLTKPLLVAVNGVAVGFGATVVAHCDIALASTSARFRLPFTELGLAPEAGSSATLPLRIGNQAAAYLLLTGDWFDAARAKELGLLWDVVEPEALLDATLAIATRIAEHPRPSIVATKRLLRENYAASFRAAREREMEAYTHLLRSDEHREAVAKARARVIRQP